MTNLNEQSAIERADALLARWEQNLSGAERRMAAEITVSKKAAVSRNTAEAGNAEGRADGILKRVGQNFSGRQLIKAAAHGYVALSAKTGALVDPLVKTWQDGVAEAQRQEEQQAVQAQGPSGARQEEANEKEGQQTLKKTTSAAADVAGAAGGS